MKRIMVAIAILGFQFEIKAPEKRRNPGSSSAVAKRSHLDQAILSGDELNYFISTFCAPVDVHEKFFFEKEVHPLKKSPFISLSDYAQQRKNDLTNTYCNAGIKVKEDGKTLFYTDEQLHGMAVSLYIAGRLVDFAEKLKAPKPLKKSKIIDYPRGDSSNQAC